MYTEANTCLYMVKWVYTRRQTRLHEKANAFALYLASDLVVSIQWTGLLDWTTGLCLHMHIVQPCGMTCIL